MLAGLGQVGLARFSQLLGGEGEGHWAWPGPSTPCFKHCPTRGTVAIYSEMSPESPAARIQEVPGPQAMLLSVGSSPGCCLLGAAVWTLRAAPAAWGSQQTPASPSVSERRAPGSCVALPGPTLGHQVPYVALPILWAKQSQAALVQSEGTQTPPPLDRAVEGMWGHVLQPPVAKKNTQPHALVAACRPPGRTHGSSGWTVQWPRGGAGEPMTRRLVSWKHTPLFPRAALTTPQLQRPATQHRRVGRAGPPRKFLAGNRF